MPLDLLDIILLLIGAGIFWWLIGGWTSFRQPRVFGPLLVVLACVAMAIWASAGIDAIRAGQDQPLGADGFGTLALVALLVAAAAFGWALVAGYKLRAGRQPRQPAAD